MKKGSIASALLACALALASCASPGIRGQSPFVQLNGISIEDSLLQVDLGVRNVNTEAMLLQQIEFSISLDDTALAVYKAPSRAGISANGTENFRFELNPSEDGMDLLHDLEAGTLPNLGYRIEGMLLVQDEEELPINGMGRIFPVPGRPGQFR